MWGVKFEDGRSAKLRKASVKHLKCGANVVEHVESSEHPTNDLEAKESPSLTSNALQRKLYGRPEIPMQERTWAAAQKTEGAIKNSRGSGFNGQRQASYM